VRFKTDENLPHDASSTLVNCGFDVETVWDECLSGADDQTIVDRAHSEARILITLDRDFADIRAYPPEQHYGIIVLRLKVQDKATVVAYIRRVAMVLEQRSPVGELWIVERDRIRFRRGSGEPGIS
jgi:predicted nuclease of predicted toxin-antitoxin system